MVIRFIHRHIQKIIVFLWAPQHSVEMGLIVLAIIEEELARTMEELEVGCRVKFKDSNHIGFTLLEFNL
jgi:hypothetical protein